MATWNLESVGTKGYGGGGSYFCARAAKAILKRKEERDEENYDGIGVFKDPLLDSVYGQCSSTTRPMRPGIQDDPQEIADFLKPTGTRMCHLRARRWSSRCARHLSLSRARARALVLSLSLSLARACARSLFLSLAISLAISFAISLPPSLLPSRALEW